jgi:hypothetical protein
MKITFLRTIGGLPKLKEGTTHDIPKAEADKFVKAGLAVEGDTLPAMVVADAEVDGEDLEAAANRVEFADRGEDSKANRPGPQKGPVPEGVPATAQRSQPQNAAPKPADKK